MAKKAKSQINKDGRGVKRETRDGIIAVALFLVSILLILSAINKAGVVGSYIFTIMTNLLGIGYYLLPIACIMLGVSFFKSFSNHHFPVQKIIGSLLFFFSGLGLIHIGLERGGIVGELMAIPFLKLFDVYASIIILAALLAIAVLIVFEAKLTVTPIVAIWNFLFSKIRRGEVKSAATKNLDEEEYDNGAEEEEDDVLPEEVEEPEIVTPFIKKSDDEDSDDKYKDAAFTGFKSFGKTYTPPPLSLLERDSGKPVAGDIKASANIIKRTLQNFGISVEMDEVSIGPSVTRYAIKPAEGVKLSKIAALQDNLAYALAAHPIRIEAPIPGKSLVGIEVPNSTKSTVGLASMLASDEYQQSDKPLLVSLGKSISGKSQFANLGKMPHLLIAGATGSGKSVTIHTLINSLIFRNSPDNLKFIMIDPKRVELTLYNKIPHLLTPVITEPKKSILSLKWAAKEMDRRYEILEKSSVRDIDSYHKNVLAPLLKKSVDEGNAPDMMPYIVIVIDELADIMTSYPRELEAAVVRLAQMSRAVGIHLILSTQRPSVNVITGLIKANVPARIALQVSSQIDSRTILDAGGAEKLLGAGDMLYLGGDMSKPLRIQSAFLTESEVKKVTKYLRDAYADELPSDIALTGEAAGDNGPSIFDASLDDGQDEVDDELYEAAREEVIHAGKASTSYIQRKLRVGYARAARLMDILEERGVIGPADGSKPREVLNPGSGMGAAEPTPPNETQS
ncbi:MAG TPA: DNA translocase FtsK 4TM domain-containing protein [Candidatus Paceibacterota bacterium]